MSATSSGDPKVEVRWRLRIVSADPSKETEFDLSLALSGEDEEGSGLTFGTFSTPYERELSAEMVLAVVASKSGTWLNSELRRFDGEMGVSVSSLRQILGKQVIGKIGCFARAF